jgi:type IV pilus assembly protein PilC
MLTDKKERAAYWRTLDLMLNSGVPVISALNAASQQTDENLRIATLEMIKSVENHSTISNAMANHPEVFSLFEIAMVKAGETTGTLDDVMGALADFFSQRLE